MFAAWKSWLATRSRRKAWRKAIDARSAALTAYADAKARNDSRAVHEAQRALSRATNDEVAMLRRGWRA